MSLRVYCPDCDTPRTLPDHWAGKRIQCRQCGRPLRVGSRNQRSDPDERADDVDPDRHRTVVWVAATAILVMAALVVGGGLVAWYVLVTNPPCEQMPEPDLDDEHFPPPGPRQPGPDVDDWD